MKVLFCIDKAREFFRGFVEYFEDSFPEQDKEYLVIDRRKEANFEGLPNTKRIESYKQFIFDPEIRQKFYVADKIIFSGIFVWHYVLMLFPVKVIKKSYLQFWGGDFYIYRKNTLSIKVLKPIMSRCVKHSAGIINLLPDEFREFYDFFPYRLRFFIAPVPLGKSNMRMIYDCRKRTENKAKEGTKRIVIGNSATETNRHLEVFEIIKSKISVDVEIYCPLSYGDSGYRDVVVKEGRKIFGQHFFPLTDYMKYENYIDFLASCSVGIYNYDRQQGLGNIYIMINLGKKIYMPSSSYNYRFLTSNGFKIYDTKELESQSIDEILMYSYDEASMNMAAYENNEKRELDEWKKVIHSKR